MFAFRKSLAHRMLLVLVLRLLLLGSCASASVLVSTILHSLPGAASDLDVDAAGELIIVAYLNYGIYRGYSNGSSRLIAGSADHSNYGSADGIGTNATFSNPDCVTCDVAANIAYISDTGNCLIRALHLGNNSVTTFAGGTPGLRDGVGTTAQFNNPIGITHHAPTGVLYIADCGNLRVRKIVISTANVTTVGATASDCFCISVSSDGVLLYVTTLYTVVMINTSLPSSITSPIVLAGNASSIGYQDGVGTTALFHRPIGIALNSDESALIVADQQNNVLRQLNLATRLVTTIAGNRSTFSLVDGPGLQATFNYLSTIKWHCNASSLLCGVLVADLLNNAIRFVAISPVPTRTASSSASTSPTAPVSMSATQSAWSLTCSHGLSASMTAHNTGWSVSGSASSTRSFSGSWTPSLTHSTSTTWRSASPSMHCALLPHADLGGSLAALFPVSAVGGAVALTVTPLSKVTGELLGAVASEAVGRQALLGRYPLAANLSLTLGGTLRGVDDPADGWALVGVQLDVVAVDAAFPLLTAAAGFTVVSSSVVGRQQLLVCVLHPPSATGWLPLTLGVFRDVTLRQRLTLRCPTDAAATQDVVIVVPSPGQPTVLTTEVSAASTAAQYSSWVAFPSTGTGVGRLSAVRGLVACDGSGGVGGLLPLPVAADCEDDASASSDAADARGAVVGNLVLWAAGCALMALLTCGYSRCAAVPLRAGAEALGVPSPLLLLVVATVPSTASSTFVLLRSLCAADRAVAALGVVMIVCPIAVLCGLSLLVPDLLHLEAHGAHWSPGGFAATLRAVVRRLLHRRVRWCCRALSGGPDLAARPLRLERVATVVLLEYAVVWYLCVDVAALTAAGLLGAVSTLRLLAACRGSAVAVGVLYVGQLVLCAAVRPYTTLFSHVHTLFCLALSAVSVWCQVWYLFASAGDGADLDALSALLAVSAVCDIAVSAASMLRTLTDVVEALRACCRHLLLLRLCSAVAPAVVARCDAAQLWLPGVPRMKTEDEHDPLHDGGDEVIAGDYCQGALKWDGGDDDATLLGIDAFGATIAVGVGSTDVVGVVTAREEMAQKHRGAAHDLLLYFDAAAVDVTGSAVD